MTTYFVTGGFGFLGQYIVQALLAHDPQAEILVLGRTRRETFLGVEKSQRVRWIQGGLSQTEKYAHELMNVEAIIHVAALVSFRKADADRIIKSNVLGTRALTQAALEAGCKNFVFISSISAVGFNPDGVTDESMYPDLEYKRQTDMYGYSKMVSEAELREVSDRMRVIMLNPSVVLGPGSDLIEAVLNAARFVPALPMLSYVNSFVDVRDVASAAVMALEKGRSGERYIVTDANVDMLTFTRMAMKAAGRKTLIVPVSNRWVGLLDGLLWILDVLRLNPGIRRISEMNVDKRLSNEKIKREFGWTPQIDFKQSVADTVKGSA
ncbi:MAG: NAD-dependent epimerase/dehydratase family protein [Anaerolineales bacterium]